MVGKRGLGGGGMGGYHCVCDRTSYVEWEDRLVRGVGGRADVMIVFVLRGEGRIGSSGKWSSRTSI